MFTMIDVEKPEETLMRVLLVGRTENRLVSDRDAVSELSGLVKTAGMKPVATVVLRRNEPSSKFGMGSGKAAEIVSAAQDAEVQGIVFNFELSPTQQRNWEKLSDLVCYDRQEIIILIFADRAMTREAVLQIDLARLVYSLPRLAHTYTALSQQRGGQYGSKGSGEKQLELDRRTILEKITQIRRELLTVQQDRSTMRKRRERAELASCAIVGYTNAGKSTLLNTLTGAGVLTEDKLFATLDPTTRRFDLPTGRTVLLIDTVGFIHELPHTLIDAFRATLEEAAFASAVIIVLDAADPNIQMQHETALGVLEEIGARSQPSLLVLNKADLLDEFTRARLVSDYPDAVMISAKTQEGFDGFAAALENLVAGTKKQYRFPLSRGDLVAMLHREGSVLVVKYEDDHIMVEAKTDGRLESMLKEFEFHE